MEEKDKELFDQLVKSDCSHDNLDGYWHENDNCDNEACSVVECLNCLAYVTECGDVSNE